MLARLRRGPGFSSAIVAAGPTAAAPAASARTHRYGGPETTKSLQNSPTGEVSQRCGGKPASTLLPAEREGLGLCGWAGITQGRVVAGGRPVIILSPTRLREAQQMQTRTNAENTSCDTQLTVTCVETRLRTRTPREHVFDTDTDTHRHTHRHTHAMGIKHTNTHTTTQPHKTRKPTQRYQTAT